MDEEILLAKGIKIGKSIFDTNIAGERDGKGLAMGGRLDFEVPKDCDLIILAGNKGGGYVPYQCLLPHQVYVEDIKKAFDEYHFEVIYVLPVKSADSILLVARSKYSLDRWQR